MILMKGRVDRETQTGFKVAQAAAACELARDKSCKAQIPRSEAGGGGAMREQVRTVHIYRCSSDGPSDGIVERSTVKARRLSSHSSGGQLATLRETRVARHWNCRTNKTTLFLSLPFLMLYHTVPPTIGNRCNAVI